MRTRRPRNGLRAIMPKRMTPISPMEAGIWGWLHVLTLIHLHRLANKHFLKVADLSALESDYYKAIQHYERIGRSSINNNLMKWSIKDYFLKAGICHLATNVGSSLYASCPPH